MLCKSVCIDCVNAYAVQNYPEGILKDLKFCWNENDESTWVKGSIECPHEGRWDFVDIESIPKTCMHKLEHAVAAGMKHA
jgi:hypothetical protein